MLHKIRGLFIVEPAEQVQCFHKRLVMQASTGETICAKCRHIIYATKKPGKPFEYKIYNKLEELA